jgi:hypothetical protein
MEISEIELKKQRKREYNLKRYYDKKALKEISKPSEPSEPYTVNTPKSISIKNDNHINNNEQDINKIIEDKMNFFSKNEQSNTDNSTQAINDTYDNNKQYSNINPNTIKGHIICYTKNKFKQIQGTIAEYARISELFILIKIFILIQIIYYIKLLFS